VTRLVTIVSIYRIRLCTHFKHVYHGHSDAYVKSVDHETILNIAKN